MSAGDTSGRSGVAFDGDACDAFEAAGDACDTFPSANETPESASDFDPFHPGKQGRMRTMSSAPKRAREGDGEGVRALLDSALSGETPAPGTEQHATDAGPLDRRLRWIVLACIAPALEAARTTPLRLVSIGLTAPDVETIDEAARSFACMIVDHPLGGALLSRDRGKERGRAHYHGIALIRSTDTIGDHWSEFVGSAGKEPKITQVDHWRGFCQSPWEKDFAEHLTRVVQYMMKPWPARYGRRSLDGDMIASGAFEGPLRAIRTAAAGGVALSGENPVEASPSRRLCLRCEKPLPVGARLDMLRHPPCRKAASKAKRKADRAAEQKRAGGPSEGER